MIIGNRLQKIFAAFLASLLFATCLTSCQKELDELPFELLDSSLESTENIAPLVLYRIVLPVTCSPELFAKAKALSQKLSAQTGVASEVVYDREEVSQKEGIIEILLGNGERTLSKKLLARLRHNDYLCHVQDTTVVLGGKTDQATIFALDRFCTELLPYATAYSFLPMSSDFLFLAEYPIRSIHLNGFELSEYRIVFDDASEQLRALAMAMQATLCEKSGYDLSVVSSAEDPKDRKQIRLTLLADEASGTARILTQEQGISLVARDSFGLSSAVRTLCEGLLTPNDDGNVTLVTNAIPPIPYQNTPHSFASLFFPSAESGNTELTELSDLVQTQDPNLVLMGRMSEDQHNAMAAMLTPKYPLHENTELFQKECVARLLSDFDMPTNDSARLYQIGNDTDGFLLLTLVELPNDTLSTALQNRTIPLLVLVHTTTAVIADQAPFWDGERFEVVLFESYLQDGVPCLFTLYAEDDAFVCEKIYGEGGYRSFTAKRLSVFYPAP